MSDHVRPLTENDELTEDEVYYILQGEGAVLSGHFVFTSKKHGDLYVNKDALFVRQGVIEMLCRALAWRVRDIPVDIVIAPAVGGVAYAYELSRLLGPKVGRAYADKTSTGLKIRRGFPAFVEGARVLAVEDIINTSKSIRELLLAIEEAGGLVQAVAALVNRGTTTAEDLNVLRLETLLNVKANIWEPEECPLCAVGMPVNISVGHGAQFLAEQAARQ